MAKAKPQAPVVEKKYFLVGEDGFMETSLSSHDSLDEAIEAAKDDDNGPYKVFEAVMVGTVETEPKFIPIA